MIKAILAVDTHSNIGKGNKLPWPKIQTDMDYFRTQTRGRPLLMGRKTWESLGQRNLPGRSSVIFSRSAYSGEELTRWSDDVWSDDDWTRVWTTRDPREYVSAFSVDPEPDRWVIGGKEILEQCYGLYDEVHVTYLSGSWDADTKVNLDKVCWGLKAIKNTPFVDEPTGIDGMITVYGRD